MRPIPLRLARLNLPGKVMQILIKTIYYRITWQAFPFQIETFQNRLDELKDRWTDKKVLEQLDEFGTSFIAHKKHFKEYLEEINAHELNIAKHYEIHQNVIDIPDLKRHEEFREIMATERSIYGELKKEFFKFISKYM